MNSSYSITSKFQVTLPKDLREELNITENDRVQITRKGNSIVIKKAPNLDEICHEMHAKWRASGIPAASNEDIKNARIKYYQDGSK